MLPLIVHTVTDSVYWTKANSVLIETLLSPLSLSMIEGIKDLKRGDASVDSFRTSCCSVQRLDLSNLCVCVCMLHPPSLVVENQLEGLKKSLPLDGAIMDFCCTKSLWLFWLLEFDHRPFLGIQ